MKHIVVDLEMNQISRKSEARKICHSETIEIGAVMLDEQFHEIAAFRTYVKPEYNETITTKISNLTGITYDMVANAPKFNEAFRMFANWCMGTGDEITIYAWSDSGFNQILKELELKRPSDGKTEKLLSEFEQAIIKSEWKDFQKQFDKHLGFERQLSLSLALEMAGIDFRGREHDALDDARNTSELLQIFNDKELFDLTLKKIEEVMKPTSLENTLGSMFDFSMFVVA